MEHNIASFGWVWQTEHGKGTLCYTRGLKGTVSATRCWCSCTQRAERSPGVQPLEGQQPPWCFTRSLWRRPRSWGHPLSFAKSVGLLIFWFDWLMRQPHFKLLDLLSRLVLCVRQRNSSYLSNYITKTEYISPFSSSISCAGSIYWSLKEAEGWHTHHSPPCVGNMDTCSRRFSHPHALVTSASVWPLGVHTPT